jgi:hypothetical protein
MAYKPILTLIGCFVVGYLTRQLQVFLDVTIINTYGGIIAIPISNAAPVLGKLAHFVMHHILEYIIGAIIIGSITSKFGPNVFLILAFLTGAIFKPVINSAKGLLIYHDSVTVSTWVKSVLIQDLISSLVVFPAVVIATVCFVKRMNEKAQPEKCT